MAAIRRQATTIWKGDLASGSGKFSGGSGALTELPVTWASRTQAPGGKTSPEELIAAAHSTCYAMALSHTLAGAGTPAESLEVTAVVELDTGAADGPRVTRSALEVVGRVPGISNERFVELARQADEGCPISNLLRGGTTVTLNARSS
ncbi:MAG TPA: OsmC family peroxiredoxin [Gammaproteobacteria bacterium]